jgi:hypothetical protein
VNLRPVLVRVFDLYAAGVTDKFDILLALGDEDEQILERYTTHVSRVCWSKAALQAIAYVVGRLGHESILPKDVVGRVHETVSMAKDAFSRFPWSLDALVEQSVELYALIVEDCPNAALCEVMNKRLFVKMCKDIAYK